MTAFGVSLWLAAFNVLYRDVRYVLPFLTQFMDVRDTDYIPGICGPG